MINYLKNLLNIGVFDGTTVIKKDDVVRQMSDNVNGVSVIMSTLDDIQDKYQIIKALDGFDNFEENFIDTLKEFNVVGENIPDALENLRTTFTNIRKVTSLYLVKIGPRENTFTNRDIQQDVAYMIYQTNLFTSLILAIPDILAVAMDNGSKEVYAPKIRGKNIDEIKPAFRIAYVSVATIEPNEINNKLKNLPEVHLDALDKDTLNDDAMLSFDLPANNFIGSPVYSFRIALLKHDVKKFEALEDKKQYLSNRIRLIESELRHVNSPKLVSAIQYFTSESNRVEKEMLKLKDPSRYKKENPSGSIWDWFR